MSSIHGQSSRSINIFLQDDPSVPMARLYGDEIHLFMHCHMRGYDRTGEGLHLDGTFFDKYGAPIHLHDFWMEGYHAIERMLADHFVSTDNPYVKFPPVAGYAGGTHLYKIGTDHMDAPWNWTGWIPRWKQHIVIDALHPKGRPLCNRYFMAFRGNEIQNDYWDYHPCSNAEEEGIKDDDFPGEEEATKINLDKYRGGYFFEGNSWGRYLHIQTIKSHVVDTTFSPATFKRYTYIVHPLAYRINTNKLPDNTVDGIQWTILNIVNEPHFGSLTEWGEKCHGLEVFNDFTYFYSYNPEYQLTPVDAPDFQIPCHNGELMNTAAKDAQRYIWWFDTYPLEYAEFLLDTALSRGVYLHPLASNDASYNRQTPLADFQAQLLNELANNPDFKMNRDTAGEDALRSDPKGAIVKRVDRKMVEKLALVKSVDGAYKRKSEKRENTEDDEAENLKHAGDFVSKLPYKDDTAFGYTTLIDPKLKLKEMVTGLSGADGILGTADDKGNLDHAEMIAFDYLLEGRHFSHLGVYGLFNYHAHDQKYPIEVQGQKDRTKPCLQMTEDMDLVFTFMSCKTERSSSFTDAPKDFLWKYSIQLIACEGEEETIHGYFNLDEDKKTRLDLTNYEKTKMKWIRFTCFEPASPQQRAWFLPIKGLAFGRPRNLMPRCKGMDQRDNTTPKMTHHIATTEEAEVIKEETEVDEEDKEEAGDTRVCHIRVLKQSDAYFDKVYAVESKDLKFLFSQCTQRESDNIYAYILQVCPNQQDMTQLKEAIPDIEANDPCLPPRIVQSVHGYLELNTKHQTRMDLNNSWDKDTVVPSALKVDGKPTEERQFVYFYAIDTETFNPIEISPKPSPISVEYDNDAGSSGVTPMECKSWVGTA